MSINHPDPKDFQKLVHNKQTDLFLLNNNNGISLTICNYGARIISLFTPDNQGRMADIACGFQSIDQYLKANEPFHGAIVGRYANRIHDGKFTIDDKQYQVAQNDGKNHLHGGPGGFHNVVWDVLHHDSTRIVLKYISADMEEGFPGNLTTTVEYELNNANELKITYTAETDKKTILNLTNHAYLNLAGEGNGEIYDHELKLNSSSFVAIDQFGIPTGKLVKVENTPFDFRTIKPIGRDLNAEHDQLTTGKGYDHSFLIDNAENGILAFAARVVEPNSGRKVDVLTTEPAIQIYIASHFNGSDHGKSGQPYVYRGALALETQHYPDSPNHPEFPTTEIKPGTPYHSQTIFKFGLV
jgi:aldose 1-epimerase